MRVFLATLLRKCLVWRGRVPFNDSLSAEGTLGPYYMKVHYYMHGYAGGKSVYSFLPSSLAPSSKSQVQCTGLAGTLHKGGGPFSV